MSGHQICLSFQRAMAFSLSRNIVGLH
jgi:hypothetical protein